jgi:hypothetical protein
MKKYFLIALVGLLASCACGGEKPKTDDGSDDDVVLGNPEKVAFVEDFYEKYFNALGDHEMLSNLMADLVSENGINVIKNTVGESQDAFVNIFKPAGLDSISDRSKLKVNVSQESENDDLLYDVAITDEQGKSTTIVLSVVGDNGSFRIDSISNPDFNQ